MTDGEALLKAILAQPDEDTPRLVYADWLEENGYDKRAGFIRRQIAVAHDLSGHHAAEMRVPRTEEYPRPLTLDLLAKVQPWDFYYDDVLAPPMVVVISDADSLHRCVAWHRGFPAIVGCTERSWHRHHVCFPVPIEAVCILDPHQSAWMIVAKANGNREYQSRVRRNVRVETAKGCYDARRQAFPKVRMFLGPCSAQILFSHCAHCLRGKNRHSLYER